MMWQFLTLFSSLPGKFLSHWVSSVPFIVMVLYLWFKIISFINSLQMLGLVIFIVVCFTAW